MTKTTSTALLLLALAGALLWWARPAAAPTPPTPPASANRAAADAALAAPPPPAADRTDDAKATSAAAPRTVATGALRIRVVATVGADDLPLGGIVVRRWPGEDALEPLHDSGPSERTDPHGELLVPTLPPGPWQIQTPSAGDLTPTRVLVVAGEETTVLLQRRGQRLVRGIVIDPAGAPVPGAELWVHRGNASSRYRRPDTDELVSRCVGSSGADGRFAAPVLASDSRIAASHPAYGDSRGRYVSSSRSEIVLVLERAHGTLEVTVRDARGDPVEGALVELQPSSLDSRRDATGALLAPRVSRLAPTDAAGRCAFAGVATGTQLVLATAWPFDPASGSVVIAADGHAELSLELRDGVIVVGTVRNGDGTPARVEVQSRAGANTDGSFSQCGARADGSFVLRRQPQRSFVVVALDGNRRVVGKRAFRDVAPGIHRCDLVLEQVSALRGRVLTADGDPLARWLVVAKAGDSPFGHTRTDEGGDFVLPIAADAVATVTAAPPDDEAVPAVAVDGAHAGAPLELRVPPARLPTGAVRGRIALADGLAVADRSLRLRRPNHSFAHRTTSADDGAFAFAGVAAGAFDLEHLQAGRWLPLRTSIELAAGERLDLDTLRLPAVGTLEFELAHGDGRPWTEDPPGIELIDAGGREAPIEQSLGLGRIRATAPPGRYRVTIRATDLIAAPCDATVVAGETRTVPLRLTIGRTCTITCNGDGRGSPEARAPLRLVARAADGTVALEQDAPPVADPRGFRYWQLRAALPFGRYEVEALADGATHYRGTIVIDDDLDAPTTVDIPAVR